MKRVKSPQRKTETLSRGGLYYRNLTVEQKKEFNKRGEKKYHKDKGYYHSEQYRQMRKRNGWNTLARRGTDKMYARAAVKNALKSGLLVRPRFCEMYTKDEQSCSDGTLQAHHYMGYTKKHILTVMFLCSRHHAMQHPTKRKPS